MEEQTTKNIKPEKASGQEEWYSRTSEEKTEDKKGGRYIIMGLLALILMTAGGTVLLLVLNYSGPEETEPELFFKPNLIPVETDNSGWPEDFTSAKPDFEIATGINLLHSEKKEALLSINEVKDRLQLSNIPDFHRDTTLAAFGYHRKSDRVAPFILIIGRSGADLIQKMRTWEENLSQDLSLLTQKDRSGADLPTSQTDQAESGGDFSTLYIQNSYARSNGEIVYGLIENQHLIITTTPQDLEDIQQSAHRHLK